MDELIAKLQRTMESDLEHFLPERTSPYFDRKQLVAGLLLAAHRYALEVSHHLFDKFTHLSSPLIVIKGSDCPECGGTGTAMVLGLHGQCPSCGHGERKHG